MLNSFPVRILWWARAIKQRRRKRVATCKGAESCEEAALLITLDQHMVLVTSRAITNKKVI